MTRRFVLCATQRSGSTMVCDDFANQEVMGIPSEYFLHYLQKGMEKPFDIEEVMALGADANGNTSIKLMSNYLGEIDHALPHNHLLSGPFANVYHALQSSIWFYVYRRELDRQALSRLRARKSGIYHLKKTKGHLKLGAFVFDEAKLRANDQLEYSTQLRRDMLAEIESIQREEQIWKSFFSAWNIKPVVLEYEFISRSAENYLAPLLTTLGYQPDPNLPSRTLARMSDTLSDDIIRQFRADTNPAVGDDMPPARAVYDLDDPVRLKRLIGSSV